MTRQYVYPDKSVHITPKDLGNRPTLHPNKKYTPKGVSFSPTIKRSLEGVPYFYNVAGKEKPKRQDWVERKRWAGKKRTWNVYTPIRKRAAVIPTTIDDFKRTGERRVLDKVKAKRMGKVRVDVKNNKWEYQWLKR